MTFPSLLLLLSFCFLLCLAWLWHRDWAHHGLRHLAAKTAHPMVHRLLKPRTPLDCPACRLASTASSGGGLAPAPVRPWSEVKSRRGVPKRVTPQVMLVPTRSAGTAGSPLLTFLHSLGMARMAVPSAFRRFVVRIAASRLVLGATLRCTV